MPERITHCPHQGCLKPIRVVVYQDVKGQTQVRVYGMGNNSEAYAKWLEDHEKEPKHEG